MSKQTMHEYFETFAAIYADQSLLTSELVFGSARVVAGVVAGEVTNGEVKSYQRITVAQAVALDDYDEITRSLAAGFLTPVCLLLTPDFPGEGRPVYPDWLRVYGDGRVTWTDRVLEESTVAGYSLIDSGVRFTIEGTASWLSDKLAPEPQHYGSMNAMVESLRSFLPDGAILQVVVDKTLRVDGEGGIYRL